MSAPVNRKRNAASLDQGSFNMQPIKERIAKKDARNSCELFEIRVTREKETSTPASLRPNDARAAFENLFKK